MSCQTTSVYDSLGELLGYPGSDYREHVAAAIGLVREASPEAAAHLERFAGAIAGQTPEQIEELFTRTFDVNPICCLEVGWHLYGDNYDRGDFLVRMRQELRRLGLEERSELPDHLIHLLPLLGRLPAAEADELRTKAIIPAVEKMLGGMEGKDSPYESVLRAIGQVLGEGTSTTAGSAK